RCPRWACAAGAATATATTTTSQRLHLFIVVLPNLLSAPRVPTGCAACAAPRGPRQPRSRFLRIPAAVARPEAVAVPGPQVHGEGLADQFLPPRLLLVGQPPGDLLTGLFVGLLPGLATRDARLEGR